MKAEESNNFIKWVQLQNCYSCKPKKRQWEGCASCSPEQEYLEQSSQELNTDHLLQRV